MTITGVAASVSWGAHLTERPDAARIRDDLATTPATPSRVAPRPRWSGGVRAMDALIIRRTPLTELAPFTLQRPCGSLVAAGRASVILYDHASGARDDRGRG